MSQKPVHVVTGPGVTVDRDGIERWCREWASELGVAIRCSFANDAQTLVDALAEAADSARGAVVNPGVGYSDSLLPRDNGLPIVWLDLDEAERPRPVYLDDPDAVAIRGRGAWGYRWAIQWLVQRLDWPFEIVRYGAERDQFGDLRLPEGEGPWPIVAFFHGGFWRERWERDTIEPLAIDFARRGYATWNLEYRRVGPFGGGWPASCEDVAAGLDKLSDIARDYPIDLDRIVYVGHSAGGHLALWAVRRLGVSATARVRPAYVVSLAGLGDLEEAARRGLGDTGNGTADMVGGPPEEVPGRYAEASPLRALPLGVPQLIVQGRLDNIPDLVDLSRLYARAANDAGDPVEFLELDDADHFELITPGSNAWPPIAERIERAVGK